MLLAASKIKIELCKLYPSQGLKLACRSEGKKELNSLQITVAIYSVRRNTVNCIIMGQITITEILPKLCFRLELHVY